MNLTFLCAALYVDRVKTTSAKQRVRACVRVKPVLLIFNWSPSARLFVGVLFHTRTNMARQESDVVKWQQVKQMKDY